ncbi:MAG: zinc ribbon domain-containing protein [Clostridia bacterium]|nr:zinc ribbon domain-containing protein [Clostridia bacterium]
MKYCQNCGTRVEDSVKYCTECGKAFEYNTSMTPSNNTETTAAKQKHQKSKEKPKFSRKKKAMIITVTIILAITLIIVSIVLSIIIAISVPRKANIELDDLINMNEFQIRLMLGKPDYEEHYNKVAGEFFTYNSGRISFYNIELGGDLTYNKDDHSISFMVYDDNEFNMIKYHISSRCDFIQCNYDYITSKTFSRFIEDYKYDSVNVRIVTTQFYDTGEKIYWINFFSEI